MVRAALRVRRARELLVPFSGWRRWSPRGPGAPRLPLPPYPQPKAGKTRNLCSGAEATDQVPGWETRDGSLCGFPRTPHTHTLDLHPAVPAVPGPPFPARGATTPRSRRTPGPHLRLGDPVPPQLHHGEVALAQRALDVVEPHPDRPALQVPRAIRHDHAWPPLQDTATGTRTNGSARRGAERAGGRRAARLGSGRRLRLSLRRCFPPAPQGPARRAPALT